MADPFSLLCEYASLDKPIQLLDFSGKWVNIDTPGVTPSQCYISFGPSLCYPALTTLTPFKSSRPLKLPDGTESAYYSLGALFYLTLRKNIPVAAYVQEAMSKGWPSVSLVDKKEVLDVIYGVVKTSHKMDMNFKGAFIRPQSIESIQKVGKRAAKESVEEQPLNKRALVEEPLEGDDQDRYRPDTEELVAGDLGDTHDATQTLKSREKSLYYKNSIFLSKSRTYNATISLMKNLLKPDITASNPQKSSNVSGSSKGPQSQGTSSSHKRPNTASHRVPSNSDGGVQMTASLLPSSIGMNINLSDPRSLLDQISSVKSSSSSSPSKSSTKGTLDFRTGKFADSTGKSRSSSSGGGACPIILVPATPSALINMYNVREFLENERYVPPEEARARVKNRKESVIYIQRKVRSEQNGSSSTLLTYQVMDNVHKWKLDDWNRLVGVFVQGVQWQFKGWKYDSPVELFSKVKGFHLKYEDESLEPLVKEWNVTVLNIHKTKRYVDVEAVLQFWHIMDAWVGSLPIFRFGEAAGTGGHLVSVPVHSYSSRREKDGDVKDDDRTKAHKGEYPSQGMSRNAKEDVRAHHPFR